MPTIAIEIGVKRLVILLAVTAVAIFLASGLAPKEPSAQTTSPAGKIVFVKRDTQPGDHLNDIWVMDADGTDQTNLTNTPETNEVQPAFSPDGTRIAFNGPGTGPDENGDEWSDIYVMDTDPSTNDATNLTNTRDFNEYQPSWAPSGTQLVFVRSVPGQSITDQSDIFVMDTDPSTNDATNLTRSDANELAPDWSPDGTKIAFSAVRDRGYEIVTMDPNGQNETILTGDSFNGDDHAPDWSPDSTKVVFMKASVEFGNCCAPWEIWAVNRDGSGDTNLTNHPSADMFPSWSPDGSEITFQSNRNADASGQSDIYAMPAPTTLPPPGETASVATDQDRDVMGLAASDVLVQDASAHTTSEPRRLTRDGSSTAPDWGPSGGACTIEGTSAADTLTGTSKADVICSLGGNDTVEGAGGEDTIKGGAGDDTLKGEGANDRLIGGGGTDALFGGGADDKVNSKDGVSGNDTLSGGTHVNGDTKTTDATEKSVVGFP